MKTVIEMAREAGCALWEDGSVSPALKHFAELVRADEREACAKVCDDKGMFHEVSQGADLAFELATAIRARSETWHTPDTKETTHD